MENQYHTDTNPNAADNKKTNIPRHDGSEYQSPELLLHFKQSRRLSLLFSTKNWGTGWYFLLWTVVPLMILNSLTEWIIKDANVLQLVTYAVSILGFFLIQIFGKRFATERYNIKIKKSFW